MDDRVCNSCGLETSLKKNLENAPLDASMCSLVCCSSGQNVVKCPLWCPLCVLVPHTSGALFGFLTPAPSTSRLHWYVSQRQAGRGWCTYYASICRKLCIQKRCKKMERISTNWNHKHITKRKRSHGTGAQKCLNNSEPSGLCAAAFSQQSKKCMREAEVSICVFCLFKVRSCPIYTVHSKKGNCGAVYLTANQHLYTL